MQRLRRLAKQKKIDPNLKNLRMGIKADIRKKRELYVTNLVGDVEANQKDFYRYFNSQKKDAQGIPPLKKRNRSGAAQSRRQVNSMVSSRMCSPKLNISSNPIHGGHCCY